MSHLATIVVREPRGISREGEAIRIGVPLARGALADVGEAALFDSQDRPLVAQFTALAKWPDRSVKWLLVDTRVSLPANTGQHLAVRRAVGARLEGAIEVLELENRLRIDTGRAVFELPRNGGSCFASVAIGGVACLDALGLAVRASGARGAALAVRFTQAKIEVCGSVRTSAICSGSIEDRGREVARLELRLIFVDDSAALKIECTIWNPRAARHVGGLWDLGDAGSVRLQDLSIELRPAQPPQQLAWQDGLNEWRNENAASWVLYQDSSGGERWNSPNHIDARGQPTVSFRGYRVQGADGATLAQGERASPAVRINSASGWICASVEKFWQNFPKALRWQGGTLGVGLFPAESAAGFELQGGEKKRHTVLIEFGRDAQPQSPATLHAPLNVALDPREVAASGAVAYLLPAAEDSNAGYARYINSIVEGEHSVSAKREIIDEFGWRNYGDLYADHEAVNHRGPEPFVSHYNNQYDFVFAAGMHFLRSGEDRWHELMVDAARHLIDIDIYHTTEDRAAFSGGLFWHTDHYQPAATCTHRTYSRRNARGPYGGGPANEHNYTSGLLRYHYLSGDPEAKAAVLTLADWVLRMDDGTLTFWGLLDPGPTGLATATVEPTNQIVGRGAGNSINALLDAYSASSRREYLGKAEEFVQRCIHPQDDIAALGLLEPEHRWSYLVFLQVLAKYLDLKRELGETDYAFHYARDSLLHYAHWMSQHEVPYKDVLNKVLLPTETWPAQDIRKSHILQLASLHAPSETRAQLQAKAAFFFERCLADLLTFPTAHLTRPQVLLSVYACQYAGAVRCLAIETPPHNHSFGQPQRFVIQRERVRSVFVARMRVAMRELCRAVAGVFARFRKRS